MTPELVDKVCGCDGCTTYDIETTLASLVQPGMKHLAQLAWPAQDTLHCSAGHNLLEVAGIIQDGHCHNCQVDLIKLK